MNNDNNSKPIEKPNTSISPSKEEIIQYLTGEYKGNYKDNSDISYSTWVLKEENIQVLCKEIEIPKSKEKAFEMVRLHDFDCELRLLKWITEDKAHRDKLITLPNNSELYNRFPELLPCIIIIYINKPYYNIDSFNAVHCSPSTDKTNSYINASYIDGPFTTDQRLFISTQTPLVSTIEHFWLMIQYQKVKTIILLSSEYESRNKTECYFPDEGDQITIGKFKIENAEPSFQLIEKCLVFRQFKVTNEETKEESLVNHIHVICWDEHSIIKQAIEIKIMEFLFNYVDECSPNSPCVVQCNNGIGRTGTFIALFNVYKVFKEQHKRGMSPYVINIFNIVRLLREQRYGMISDTVHYRSIYRLSIDLLRLLN